MTFGVVLLTLIVLLAVALLVVIIGYVFQMFKKYGAMKKPGESTSSTPAIAPDPDVKKSSQTDDTSQPPQSKT